MKSVSRKKLAQVFVEILDRHSKHAAIQALAHFIFEERLEHDVDLIIREISRELLHRKGYLMAEVISARQTSQSLLEDLTAMLKLLTTATTVNLTTHVAPEIVGGVILITPDFEIDTSIRRQLQLLEV